MGTLAQEGFWPKAGIGYAQVTDRFVPKTYLLDRGASILLKKKNDELPSKVCSV
jgi:hypothetical protein